MAKRPKLTLIRGSKWDGKTERRGRERRRGHKCDKCCQVDQVVKSVKDLLEN